MAQGKPRRARTLASDPAYQTLLTSLSAKVDRLIRRRGCSIAAFAAEAGLSESALQDVLKTTSDPKVSTLYALARAADCSVYVFFEAGQRQPTDG